MAPKPFEYLEVVMEEVRFPDDLRGMKPSTTYKPSGIAMV